MPYGKGISLQVDFGAMLPKREQNLASKTLADKFYTRKFLIERQK
jgi:hypothetical protein